MGFYDSEDLVYGTIVNKKDYIPKDDEQIEYDEDHWLISDIHLSCGTTFTRSVSFTDFEKIIIHFNISPEKFEEILEKVGKKDRQWYYKFSTFCTLDYSGSVSKWKPISFKEISQQTYDNVDRTVQSRFCYGLIINKEDVLFENPIFIKTIRVDSNRVLVYFPESFNTSKNIIYDYNDLMRHFGFEAGIFMAKNINVLKDYNGFKWYINHDRYYYNGADFVQEESGFLDKFNDMFQKELLKTKNTP